MMNNPASVGLANAGPNDGNVPTQYAASTASDQTMKFASTFCQQLRTLQVPSR